MGLEDRDYYRDHISQLEGRQKIRARPIAELLSSAQRRRHIPWRIVGQVLLFIAICVGTFLLLRLFKR